MSLYTVTATVICVTNVWHVMAWTNYDPYRKTRINKQTNKQTNLGLRSEKRFDGKTTEGHF